MPSTYAYSKTLLYINIYMYILALYIFIATLIPISGWDDNWQFQDTALLKYCETGTGTGIQEET